MAAERKNVITARVTNKGFFAIEQLAVEHGLSRSLVARAMFAVALQHPREVKAILETYKT